jgi:uncharacterized protein (DUF1800 family)
MSTGSLKPLPREEFDYWKAQHLLNRAGLGGTPGQARALADMGLEDAVSYIVDYESAPAPDDAAETKQFRADIMRPPSADEQMEARRARQSKDEAALERLQNQRQERERTDRGQIASMQKWWLKRMIETGRPLEEKLTLFWHGHFATGYRTIEDSWHMFQQNQLFRKHASGNFADLVFQVIRDPAMLEYLDNNDNRRQSPNENLARELMELFVLGEGNGYSEKDIKEGARALTGYTFDDDAFVFREDQHDPAPKSILGKPAADGDDFVRIILGRKVASEFICNKLYRFFVNDAPGTPTKEAQAFVEDLADLFRRKDYELKPVLKAMFTSAHFYDESNIGSLIKNPVQLVVQAIRSLRTPTRQLSALVSACDLMGQNIFFPPSVKGWDVGRAWINTSTLFVRQNVLIYLLTGRRPDQYDWQAETSVCDLTHLVAHMPDLARPDAIEEAMRYLLRFALGREPHADRMNALIAFIRQHGNRIDNDRLIGAVALMTAMPEYQLC